MGRSQITTLDSAAANAHLNLLPDGKMLILSGATGLGTSFDEAAAADVAFYVSGTVGSRGTPVAGTSVFGGDVHISGSITSTGTSFVDVSGTPADNQIAIWTDSDTLEGTSILTYDGTTINLNDAVTVNEAGDAANDFRVESVNNAHMLFGSMPANKSRALEVGSTGADPLPLLFSGSLTDAAGYGSSAQ